MKVHSIITGNKNWCIKALHEDKEIIHGRPGHFYPGFFSCRLIDICKYDWYYFTKKKDYDEAVAKLIAVGYKDANKAYGWL
jgi:hypothetical protein